MTTKRISDESPENSTREGALIRRRRLARLFNSPGALSAAMKESGYNLSGSRIHDIEQGSTRTGKPTKSSVVNLVQLALFLGISVSELRSVGRSDAAEVLQEHLQLRAEDDLELDGLGVSPAMREMIATGLNEIRSAPGLTDRQKQDLTKTFLARYERSTQEITDTIHETLRAIGGEDKQQ